MFIKKSVVLLLSVIVLVSFSNQREAAVEAAESLGYVDFVQAPSNGGDVALELAEDYLAEYESDLVLGDPQPLYGYGYGDTTIAYMIFADPRGEVRTMEDFQEHKMDRHLASQEFNEWRKAIEEEGLSLSEAVIPENLLAESQYTSQRSDELYLLLIGFFDYGAEIIVVGHISGGVIGLHKDDFDNLAGYGLILRSFPAKTFLPFAILCVAETNERGIHFPYPEANFYKPVFKSEQAVKVSLD